MSSQTNISASSNTQVYNRAPSADEQSAGQTNIQEAQSLQRSLQSMSLPQLALQLNRVVQDSTTNEREAKRELKDKTNQQIHEARVSERAALAKATKLGKIGAIVGGGVGIAGALGPTVSNLGQPSTRGSRGLDSLRAKLGGSTDGLTSQDKLMAEKLGKLLEDNRHSGITMSKKEFLSLPQDDRKHAIEAAHQKLRSSGIKGELPDLSNPAIFEKFQKRVGDEIQLSASRAGKGIGHKIGMSLSQGGPAAGQMASGAINSMAESQRNAAGIFGQDRERLNQSVQLGDQEIAKANQNNDQVRAQAFQTLKELLLSGKF